MSNKTKSNTLLGLSNSEQKILLLSLLCTDESNKLDLEKLAQYGGYKNSASASTTYRNAKRKLSEYKPESPISAEASSAANTPKRGRPLKKAAAAAETPMAADPEPAEQEAAPAPKAKRQCVTKKGIAKVVKKDSYDSEDIRKTGSGSSKAEAIIKSEESSVKEEQTSTNDEMTRVKQEAEGVDDDCKTEDENPMTSTELDAQLDVQLDTATKGDF